MQPVVIRPIGQIILPEDLSGASGANRATGKPHINAADDRMALLTWLARYPVAPPKLGTYRKEIERFLLWAIVQRQVALSDLVHEDVAAYRLFLSDPQPQERWVRPAGPKLSPSSPFWRPFDRRLTQTAQRQAMSVIGEMFAWLVEVNYLRSNPYIEDQPPDPIAAPRSHPILPLLVEFRPHLEATVASMPLDTKRQAEHAARMRWLLALLFIGKLGPAEIVEATMARFAVDPDRDSDAPTLSRWRFRTSTEDGKTRWLPVGSEWLDELMRYRRSLGCHPLPEGDEEDMPLLAAVNDARQPMSLSGAQELVKGLMVKTAARLRTQGAGLHPLAAKVTQTASQWRRNAFLATRKAASSDKTGDCSLSTGDS